MRILGRLPVGWWVASPVDLQITEMISVGVTPDVDIIRTEPGEPMHTNPALTKHVLES